MIQKHHQFMIDFTKTMLFNFRRPVFLYLTTLGFSVMLFCSGLFYYVEGLINPHVQNYFDSLYYTVTIMTGVGLGDISPVTRAGKAFSMIMMVIGTGLYVSFTAVFAAIVLETELKHKRND